MGGATVAVLLALLTLVLAYCIIKHRRQVVLLLSILCFIVITLVNRQDVLCRAAGSGCDRSEGKGLWVGVGREEWQAMP